MKTSFKTLLEGAPDYHVKHVEDLDVETFIRVIERVHELDAVQKLDGANLRGGIDEDAKLYTSREQKGGKRFYSLKDFPKRSAFDGFRAAHAVLEQVEHVIKDIVAPGEAFNMEVIYGEQPNTVLYGKDRLNYLAILEMVPGDDPTIDPDQRKTKQLIEALNDHVITVDTLAHETHDGSVIVSAPKITDWKIVGSDKISKHDLEELDFSEELGNLKKFLETDNEVARKEGKILTNFEVLKDKSPKLSEERKKVDEKIRNDFKLPIKEKLMRIVKKQKPSLRGETTDSGQNAGTYTGIEGIIFTDKKTRERFKVVDRDVFTKINQFNYEVRKSINSTLKTSNTDLPVEERGGLVGEAHIRSVRLLGLPGAEMPAQVKRVIEKLKGESRDATVKNIIDSLHQLNFQAIRRKIQAVYISTIDDVDDARDSFKQNADTYSLKLSDDQEIKYTPEIKRRTLMVFAEARKTLEEILVKVKKTQDMEDLIELLFKKYIDELHGGDDDEF